MSLTVLVTGGTRGIGKACAQEFLKKGCRVVVTYKSNDEAAKAFEKECATDALLVIKCDVSKLEAVKKCFEETERKFGGVDILINNAAIASQKLFCDVTREEWDEMFDVNVGSLYNTVKCVYDHMVRKKWGRIINLSSIWGIAGASCEVSYSASKAAVIGFTKALAKELGPSGICVNCVAPGVINTDMNSHLTSDDMNALCEETPLCRIGSADEVAKLICYLASDDASFITGQVISPNGGIVI